MNSQIHTALLTSLVAILYSPIAFASYCTPNSDLSCGSCPDYSCEDFCSGTKTEFPTITKTIYYGTLGEQTYSGTYLQSTQVFHDEKYECYSGTDESCSSQSYYIGCNCKDANCLSWQTCSDEGSDDEKKGCICNKTYCEGWCMDNAPVYDGLAGCSELNLDCDSEGGNTICELYFGGTCEASDDTIIVASGNRAVLQFCSGYVSSGYTQSEFCYLESTVTCVDLGGTCIEKLSWLNILEPSDAYCGENSESWRVAVEDGGLEFSDCPGMDCCVPKDTSLVTNDEVDPLELACSGRYSLNTDPHTSSGGTCYCNYLEINEFQECDDTWIDDSHPCKSGNCAPDFAGGYSFCCPEGQCSHLEDDRSISCYSEGHIINYEGVQLECDEGLWNTILGCGTTVFNYPLYSETASVFDPDSYYSGHGGYGFSNTPISFNLGELSNNVPTDVIASATPAEDYVKIKLINATGGVEQVATGDTKLEANAVVGAHQVRFVGDTSGKPFNLSVNCYTPDESFCNRESSSCRPGSFCVEDSPTTLSTDGEKICQTYNITEYSSSGSSKTKVDIKNETCFYCCPEDQCAHAESPTEIKCYEEGVHEIDGCKWVCQDNEWGKGGDSNIECNKDCDCNLPDNSDFRCTPALVDDKNGNERNLCCNQTSCAVDNHCVDTGTRVWHNGKLNVCQSDGTWIGSGIKVITNYRRIILNKEKSEVEVKLELRKDDLFDVETASAKIYHFFDNSQFTGDITITSTDESGDIQNDYEGLAESEIKVPSGDSTLEINEIPYSYKATISTDIPNDEYLIYLGSVMVVEAE